MAIRIREVDGTTIAICAAMSEEKEGDIYIGDAEQYALSMKFHEDYCHANNKPKESYNLGNDPAPEYALMFKEQGNRLHWAEGEYEKYCSGSPETLNPKKD